MTLNRHSPSHLAVTVSRRTLLCKTDALPRFREIELRDQRPPTAGLNSLISVLKKLREVNPQFTLTNALTFLVIARDESAKVSQSELCREFRVVDATVSRMVRALTPEGERGKPGLGLVELEQDPNDKRRKIIRLTPEGERLRNSILSSMR